MEPLLVITNSSAGSASDDALEAALRVLREGTSVEVCATSDQGELDGALHRAASRRIVVAGGDGSLHAVVRALHRRAELTGRVLGLVPLGTGNDFAREVGLPLDAEEAARVVLEGAPRAMDVLVDEVGEIVVNNVHVGAGAAASRRAADWKSRLGRIGVGPVNLGRLGYPIGTALTAIDPPTLRLRVVVDDEVVMDMDQRLLMVALGNGSTVGGGLALNPDADPESGLIDVMVSRALSPGSRLSYAVGLARGAHGTREDVLHVTGRSVSVSGEEFWVSADGEVYGPERQRTWRVEPAAYEVVLPRG